MVSDQGPFHIIRLHNRDERCWGVINAKGALIIVKSGLAIRMTRDEAIALASAQNWAEPTISRRLRQPTSSADWIAVS